MKQAPAVTTVWIALAAVGVIEGTALPEAADAPPTLQGLQRKMSSVRTVYLEFVQERHLKLFTEPLKSEGVMLVDRPDLIRWETTSPYQSILLGDHKSVAQFENTEGVWTKLKLGFPQLLRRVMEQMVLMHEGKLDALTNDFTISMSAGSVVVLTLAPKEESARSIMSSVEVRMAPDFSATFEVVINEPGGDFTRIIFRRERRNVRFAPGTFDQTKPLDIGAVRTALNREP
jgi:outer membrane lipoprotein-sorting protein